MLKKKLKKAVSIFQWLLTIVLISVVLLLIFTTFNPIKSFQIFRVMSGSMEPKIKVGSVVFVQKVKPEILKEGNIITFTSREDPNMSITHRLIAIEEKEGQTVFKTRGDANNAEDIAEVSSSQIKGRVIFSLPFLGYLSVWIRKPLGFGLLVILPALLIIISEILNIKKTIEKEVEKKYAEPEKQPKSKSIGSLLIFFLLGISLFQIKPTNAYFSDVLVIEGNTFSMASDWPLPPTPTPTPASVVINEVYYYLADNKKGESAESKYEWIELYNPTSQRINLKNWEICDNHICREIHPNIDINPDEFVLVSHDASIWQLYWNIPLGTKTINLGGPIGNGLANTADMLILKDSDGNIIDQMNWGTPDPGWPNYNLDLWNPGPTVLKGNSLARITKGHDTNSASDWVELTTPNPGTNPHPSEENKEEEDQSVLIEESPEPSATPTPSPTLTTEPTPTPSPTPETSPTPTPTAEPSPTSTPSSTLTGEPESTPTPTPTPTPEPSNMPNPTPTPTAEPPANEPPADEPPTDGPPKEPQIEEQPQNQTPLPEEGSEINE